MSSRKHRSFHPKDNLKWFTGGASEDTCHSLLTIMGVDKDHFI